MGENNSSVELTVNTILGEVITVEAQLIKQYTKGRLYFAQEHLILTDLNDKVLKWDDVIDFIEEVLS